MRTSTSAARFAVEIQKNTICQSMICFKQVTVPSLVRSILSRSHICGLTYGGSTLTARGGGCIAFQIICGSQVGYKAWKAVPHPNCKLCSSGYHLRRNSELK